MFSSKAQYFDSTNIEIKGVNAGKGITKSMISGQDQKLVYGQSSVIE